MILELEILRLRHVRRVCWVLNNSLTHLVFRWCWRSLGFPWSHHSWIHYYLLMRNLSPLHDISRSDIEFIDGISMLGLEIMEDSVLFLIIERRWNWYVIHHCFLQNFYYLFHVFQMWIVCFTHEVLLVEIPILIITSYC